MSPLYLSFPLIVGNSIINPHTRQINCFRPPVLQTQTIYWFPVLFLSVGLNYNVVYFDKRLPSCLHSNAFQFASHVDVKILLFLFWIWKNRHGDRNNCKWNQHGFQTSRSFSFLIRLNQSPKVFDVLSNIFQSWACFFYLLLVSCSSIFSVQSDYFAGQKSFQ